MRFRQPGAAAENKENADEDRRTCFIGGLDFAESEEKLRTWVETTLTKERGEPDADDELETRWVERVRIVRDKATGLGKGFAYVLLKVCALSARIRTLS